METADFQKFTANLLQLGFNYSPGQARTLYETAKHCVRQSGVPAAGIGFLWGLTVSNPVAGALTGLLAGTLQCTLADRAVTKKALDEIVNGSF